MALGALHPKFEEQVCGNQQGAHLEFNIAFGEEDAPSEALKNKTIEFKVDIVGHEKGVQPDIDDAFAATMIPDATVETMRERIKTDLLTGQEQEGKQAVESQLLQQLLEAHAFEVPEGAVSKRRESLSQEVASRMMGQGYPEKAVKDMLPMIFADTAPRAERDVRVSFLLKAIADAESIEVDDTAVEVEISKYAEAQGQSLESVISEARNEGRYETLREELKSQQALDFIVKNATIKEVTSEEYQKHMEKLAKKEEQSSRNDK